MPEPADSVRGLFGQLWAEAWNSAMKVHEPERQAFARDRKEYEPTKAEMLSDWAEFNGWGFIIGTSSRNGSSHPGVLGTVGNCPE